MVQIIFFNTNKIKYQYIKRYNYVPKNVTTPSLTRELKLPFIGSHNPTRSCVNRSEIVNKKKKINK